MAEGPKSTRRSLNDLLAVRAYEGGRGHLPTYPISIYMQIASACNLDCYMCSEHNRPPRWRHGRGATSMPPELYEKIARELFPHATWLTIGVGGEPMISPHFSTYVQRAHGAGLRVHVMTNGTRIRGDDEAEVLAGCTQALEISVDAATRETYERIRLGAKWKALLANLERLDRFRQRAPAQERTHLTLCFVLMKSNAAELPAFVELARQVGADRVSAWHVIPVTEEGRGESLFDDQDRSNRILAEARAKGQELGIELDVPRAFPEEVAGADDGMAGYVDTNAPEQVQVSLGVEPGPPPVDVEEDEGLGAGEAGERELVVRDHPFPDPRPDSGAPGQGPPTEGGVLREICRHEPGAGRIHCSSPSTSIFIFYDGRVLPCCHPHAHASMTMGNLMTQSFQEIWNGRLYRNLRAGLFTGDAPPLCRKCSIVHSPPPVVEDPQELIGPGRDLCSYYAGRDLASDEAPDAAWVIETLQDPWGNLEHERDAQQGHIRTLERERAAQRGHIRNLERILDKIHGIPIYRFLGRIKSIFVKKAPE